MLGLYVSDHPLLGLGGALAAAVTHSILDLWDVVDQSQVTAGGIVTGLTRRYTKNGEPMLFFRLEDMEAGIEVACFPKLVAEAGPLIREDAVITVSGRLDHRGDSVKLVAAQVRELRAIPAVRIVVDSVALSQQAIERLKGVLSNHPGPTEVHLHISTDTAGRIPTVVRLGDDYRVETTGSLLAEIRELFGPRALI
jgi:DNA polymerase-3 subunit alpha